jgi:hypothetical protein
MSSTPIQQAKLKLPLPLLIQQLGLGDHAKKNAQCPFHDDSDPSFSVFQIDGSWFFKCHAGCGEGDEINFLEKHKGISGSEASKLYLEMAGCTWLTQTAWRKPNNEDREPFDWLHCVDVLTERHLERLGNERWFSREFCSWLCGNKLVGLYNDCIAFPVHNEAGTVVGAHYRLEDGSWRYFPHGIKTAPFIIGDLSAAKQIHVFESQWDALAFADRTDLYQTGGVAFIATRGACNAALVKGLIPPSASVCAWPQNDDAGEKWLRDLCAYAGVTVAKAVVPTPYKDVNEWTKAGASAEDLYAAMWRNEVFHKPLKPEPIELGTLLDETMSALKRYITFTSDHQAVLTTLWIAHVHCIDHFDITGYLHITSPAKRCGKTNLLTCLSHLTPRVSTGVTPTPAVLYRKIEQDCPTLLLDEADRLFKDGENSNQDILAILNAGYKRGAVVYRCGGANRDKLESFHVFCAKAFSSIGGLPETTQDRCFPIRLERRIQKPGRPRQKFRERYVKSELQPIRDRFAEWGKGEDIKNRLTVSILDSAFPELLGDRAVEICEPLYVIAILAGGDWYDRIRAATAAIFGAEEDDNKAILQLAAIRDAFQNDEHLSTSELIDRLLNQDDSPFPNWWLKEADKKAIGKSLAGLLKPFSVKAKKFRIDGEQVRGYERVDLEPVWGRYCTSINNAHALSGDLDVLDVSCSVRL